MKSLLWNTRKQIINTKLLVQNKKIISRYKNSRIWNQFILYRTETDPVMIGRGSINHFENIYLTPASKINNNGLSYWEFLFSWINMSRFSKPTMKQKSDWLLVN